MAFDLRHLVDATTNSQGLSQCCRLNDLQREPFKGDFSLKPSVFASYVRIHLPVELLDAGCFEHAMLPSSPLFPLRSRHGQPLDEETHAPPIDRSRLMEGVKKKIYLSSRKAPRKCCRVYYEEEATPESYCLPSHASAWARSARMRATYAADARVLSTIWSILRVLRGRGCASKNATMSFAAASVQKPPQAPTIDASMIELPASPTLALYASSFSVKCAHVASRPVWNSKFRTPHAIDAMLSSHHQRGVVAVNESARWRSG